METSTSKRPVMILVPAGVSRNTDLLSPCEQTVTKPWLLRPRVLPFILTLFWKSWRRGGRDIGHWLSLNRKSSPQTCAVINRPYHILIVHNGTEAIVHLFRLLNALRWGAAYAKTSRWPELWQPETPSFDEEQKKMVKIQTQTFGNVREEGMECKGQEVRKNRFVYGYSSLLQ